MPRKSDNTSINDKKLDRRVKLSEDDKDLIRWLREEEKISQRKLAAQFNVSRRTIQFVLDPKKLEENKKRRAERGGTMQYYDREKHRDYMKEHRDYKNELYKKGLIGDATAKQTNRTEGETSETPKGDQKER